MNDSQSARRGTEERRAQLVDAARRRCVADGYARTSVAAIVRDAGVAQGTFSVYFDSKQAVLAEIRRQVFREYAAALGAAAELPLPADARLAETVRSMVVVVSRNLALERVFRQAETASELERAALEGRSRLAKAAGRFLADGAARGELVVDDAEVAAELIVTLFDHILYESMTYGRPTTPERTASLALRFVLRGLGVGAERVNVLAGVADED